MSSIFKYVVFGLVLLCVVGFLQGVVGQMDGGPNVGRTSPFAAGDQSVGRISPFGAGDQSVGRISPFGAGDQSVGRISPFGAGDQSVGGNFPFAAGGSPPSGAGNSQSDGPESRVSASSRSLDILKSGNQGQGSKRSQVFDENSHLIPGIKQDLPVPNFRRR